ncbi:hypothetical protein [Undibacterium sp. Xuan67W]|uniref:hypothetical protein n=1 Tax=Undibacterium sp. Xuan67W TaxID=3413057 RepID=UPI003BF05E70
MMISTPREAESLRAEIAALAARMIAEDGADYGSAKRRAAKQLLGNQKVRGDVMPDNQQIEQEVREYNAIFFGDTQPQRLLELREIALDVMQLLERFNPYLVGAVMNGTAGDHSDIYLHLFTDNGKDVAIFLLNQDIRFEVTENTSSKRHEPVETLSFMYQQEGVHLALYNQDDLRAGGRNERAGMAAVAALISESQE